MNDAEFLRDLARQLREKSVEGGAERLERIADALVILAENADDFCAGCGEVITDHHVYDEDTGNWHHECWDDKEHWSTADGC